MSEKEWASYGFPPLRLATNDLQALLELAGPTATLSVDGATTVEATSLVPSNRSWTAKAVIKSPELKLEFGDDHASLTFDNHTAILADDIAQTLCPKPRSGLSMLLPIALGAVVFASLMLVEIRSDIASLVAMAIMLVGIVLTSKLRTPVEPSSAPDADAAGTWRTVFPTKSIGFDDLAQVVTKLKGATFEFDSDKAGPLVRICAPGIAVTLRALECEILYDDAVSRMEELYEKVQSHRQSLRWLTHDDFAIVAGMLLPIGAIVLTPQALQTKAALISVVPWLGYLVWVLRNQSTRWSIIKRSELSGCTQELP